MQTHLRVPSRNYPRHADGEGALERVFLRAPAAAHGGLRAGRALLLGRCCRAHGQCLCSLVGMVCGGVGKPYPSRKGQSAIAARCQVESRTPGTGAPREFCWRWPQAHSWKEGALWPLPLPSQCCLHSFLHPLFRGFGESTLAPVLGAGGDPGFRYRSAVLGCLVSDRPPRRRGHCS